MSAFGQLSLLSRSHLVKCSSETVTTFIDLNLGSSSEKGPSIKCLCVYEYFSEIYQIQIPLKKKPLYINKNYPFESSEIYKPI